MLKRIGTGVLVTLSLISMLTLAFNVQPVESSGTIHIRTDGSIDPPDAPISTVDNVTYTFTDNNYDEIVVQRSNVIIDGVGYVVEGGGSGEGFYLSSISNVTIKNTNIRGFNTGIYLDSTSKNIIYGNNITNNFRGFEVYYGSNNKIYENNLINNSIEGIRLYESSNNTLSGNVMNNNTYNFGVYGDELGHFMHSIDTSNLVNGLPIYYLMNQKDLAINPATHPEVGYLALANSTNVTIEGLTLTNNLEGLLIINTNNSRITDNVITNNTFYGVRLYSSFNNTVTGNNITDNGPGGVKFDRSSNNTVSENNVENYLGVVLSHSSNNAIYGNNITDNYYGVFSFKSSNNKFYHNSFIHSAYHVFMEASGYANSWDDGYPSGGNYWSDYGGTDLCSGPHQNLTGSDGIGDTPHNIDENNEDNYPLMGMFYDTVDIEWGQIYHVTAISNSTVSDLHVITWLSSPNEYLQPYQKFIDFYVTGEEGTVGFCRTMIPRAVLNDSYTVLVDWQEVPVKELPISNSTHAYLYFTYNHSTKEVIIIPEFSSFLILPLFMIATLLAVVVYKRKHV